MEEIWNNEMTEECMEITNEMITLEPHEGKRSGLEKMKNLVISLFSSRGFDIEIIDNKEAPYRPVLICRLDSCLLYTSPSPRD